MKFMKSSLDTVRDTCRIGRDRPGSHKHPPRTAAPFKEREKWDEKGFNLEVSTAA